MTTTELLFLGATLALLVAMAVTSTLLERRRQARAAAIHDWRKCRVCVQLRHPANRARLHALRAVPRQTRGGGR